MLFVEYVFDVLENGTIVMDKDLDAKKLNVRSGDQYVVNVTFDGRVIFQKVNNERNSGVN